MLHIVPHDERTVFRNVYLLGKVLCICTSATWALTILMFYQSFLKENKSEKAKYLLPLCDDTHSVDGYYHFNNFSGTNENLFVSLSVLNVPVAPFAFGCSLSILYKMTNCTVLHYLDWRWTAAQKTGCTYFSL